MKSDNSVGINGKRGLTQLKGEPGVGTRNRRSGKDSSSYEEVAVLYHRSG